MKNIITNNMNIIIPITIIMGVIIMLGVVGFNLPPIKPSTTQSVRVGSAIRAIWDTTSETCFISQGGIGGGIEVIGKEFCESHGLPRIEEYND